MGKSSFRYERKFFISAFDEHEVENMVQLHPAFFREAFPPRFINNIYLDSQRYDSFFDNVEGVSHRCKVRIRWYGDHSTHVEVPRLEFKIKNGLFGSKKQFDLSPFTFDNTFNINRLQRIISDSGLPPAEKIKLTNLIPTLVNRYRRKYYESMDRRFRITIDSQMSFRQIDQHSNLFLNNKTDEQNIVLELKYDKMHEHEASNISNFFPFRMTKSSKYVNGISLLHKHFAA